MGAIFCPLASGQHPATGKCSTYLPIHSVPVAPTCMAAHKSGDMSSAHEETKLGLPQSSGRALSDIRTMPLTKRGKLIRTWVSAYPIKKSWRGEQGGEWGLISTRTKSKILQGGTLNPDLRDLHNIKHRKDFFSHDSSHEFFTFSRSAGADSGC
jgi:hypothetical protein